MKKLKFSTDTLKLLSKRAQKDTTNEIINSVKEILEKVQLHGDKALKEYTEKFDCPIPRSLRVTVKEFAEAKNTISSELSVAIETARQNITTFHKAQISNDVVKIETSPGITCWRSPFAIQRVGIYVPGGSAPLVSSLLMLSIPATLAGCSEIALATPPRKDGTIAPAILYTAELLGIKELYAVGGAQAIAALAYGTETIRAVSKIAGPGNRYVTTAKQLISSKGLPIDMPAGPSEVAVIADKDASPRFVAADLLSQAEHDIESKLLLVTLPGFNFQLLLTEVAEQASTLPRCTIAKKAFEQALVIEVESVSEAADVVNMWAPEHLLVNTKDPHSIIPYLKNSGSVFLGALTPESLGDYASGTNHVLPTSGWARSWSGVSVDTFRKWTTFQEATHAGLAALSETVVTLARAEGLEAHAQAVLVRTSNSKNTV
jgi:histidinol dehydrogenase